MEIFEADIRINDEKSIAERLRAYDEALREEAEDTKEEE